MGAAQHALIEHDEYDTGEPAYTFAPLPCKGRILIASLAALPGPLAFFASLGHIWLGLAVGLVPGFLVGWRNAAPFQGVALGFLAGAVLGIPDVWGATAGTCAVTALAASLVLRFATRRMSYRVRLPE